MSKMTTFRTNNSKLLSVCYFLLATSLFFVSCASASDPSARYVRIDEPVENHDFEEAVRALVELQSGEQPLHNTRDAISLNLNKGLLEHYAGNYSESANSLSNAERLIQEAFTKSVTDNVASYIVNDNTKEYPGEDFEDIYISVFNAINYFKLGNIDGALVEVRKLTLPSGKLDMLERKYEDLNAKAKSGSENDFKQIENSTDSSKPESRSVTFTNSALARYLSILFYQADGNDDAVRIELEQLKSAFDSQPGIYSTTMPSAVNNLVAFTSGQARLDILSFTGLSPIKEEREFLQYFPFFQSRILRGPIFKLPVLVSRNNRVDRVEVVVNDKSFDLEVLEDMGAVIIDTFNARFSNIFLKTYIRTLAKYTLLDVANRQAKKDASAMAQLAIDAGTVAAKVAFDATEKADIRMSRYLPNKAYIGNINLAPGTYTVTINYYSEGTMTRTMAFEGVEVKSNSVNLVNVVNLDRQRRIREGGEGERRGGSRGDGGRRGGTDRD